MSPFAGEGVNMALYDAYLLAESFKNFNNLTEVLKVYEQQMFEITKIHAKESQDNLEIFSRKMVQEKMTQFFLDVENNFYKLERSGTETLLEKIRFLFHFFVFSYSFFFSLLYLNFSTIIIFRYIYFELNIIFVCF